MLRFGIINARCLQTPWFSACGDSTSTRACRPRRRPGPRRGGPGPRTPGRRPRPRRRRGARRPASSPGGPPAAQGAAGATARGARSRPGPRGRTTWACLGRFAPPDSGTAQGRCPSRRRSSRRAPLSRMSPPRRRSGRGWRPPGTRRPPCPATRPQGTAGRRRRDTSRRRAPGKRGSCAACSATASAPTTARPKASAAAVAARRCRETIWPSTSAAASGQARRWSGTSRPSRTP
mmetsp:Transcript_116552/g.324822  ORF Transcript_116552/g.324822 Transcript_116552/m.324822 type:complete len:234 (+) Transcript_116552:386-1087(+)